VIEASDSGTFYKYINRRLGKKHDIGVIRSENGVHSVTNSSKAETLNSYFSLANTRDDGNDPVFQRRVPDDVNIAAVYFTPETLFKIGKKLKSKTSSDSDACCYYLLKQILPAIASPLCLMYESFVSVGKMPDGWITAVITPVLKRCINSVV